MSPRYPVNTSLALASLDMRTRTKDLQGQKDTPNQSGWVNSEFKQRSMRERETHVLHLFIHSVGDIDGNTLKYRYVELAGEGRCDIKVDFMSLLGESLGLAEAQPREVPGIMWPCIF